MSNIIQFILRYLSIGLFGVVIGSLTFYGCGAPKASDTKDKKATEGTDGGTDSTDDNKDDDKDDDVVDTDGGDGTDGTTDGTTGDGVKISAVEMDTATEYKVGDKVAITVKMTEKVTVTGTPRLNMKAGATSSTMNIEVFAEYVGEEGETDTLEFEYTVAGGDYSPFGLKPEDDLFDFTDGGIAGIGGADVDLQLGSVQKNKFTGLKIYEGLKEEGGVLSFHGGNAATGCWDYKEDKRYLGAGDGLYKVTIGGTEIDAFCDMSSTDDAWMLVLNYNHAAGTTPATMALSNKLPISSANPVGTDESADADAWGHADQALIDAIAPSFYRFECQEAAGLVMDMRVQEAAPSSNDAAGSGAAAGACTNGTLSLLTPLDTHTQAAPATGALCDAGRDIAAGADRNFLNTPFAGELGAETYTANWNIANGGAWECGGTNADASLGTLHRVWVTK